MLKNSPNDQNLDAVEEPQEPNYNEAKTSEFSKLRFTTCAIGIFGFYFCFGAFQEKITRGTYGNDENQERFTCTMALVLCLCSVNYLFAVIVSALLLKEEIDNTKTLIYSLSSLTYLVAMVTSNKALLWVNYPTQVVGKSCKPISVMILGFLIGRKRYPILKYVFVLMIVVGVALFMINDGKETNNLEGEGVIGVGGILLLASLMCDGINAAAQERMKAEYNTKSVHMMKAMNKWSIIYLGIGLLWSGELWNFVAFVERHPSILWQLACVSVASALGQYFVFMCISEYGPLPCSLITTTRKFFNVLLSVTFFKNHLNERQWLGAILVFSGLALNGSFGKLKPMKYNSDVKVHQMINV